MNCLDTCLFEKQIKHSINKEILFACIMPLQWHNSFLLDSAGYKQHRRHTAGAVAHNNHHKLERVDLSRIWACCNTNEKG